MTKNTEQNHPQIDPAIQQQLERKRKRIENRYRIILGAEQLIAKPWKNIFAALLVTAFAIAWMRKDDFFDFPKILAPISGYIMPALILSIFFALLIGLLTILGTPWKAQADLESLRMAFTDADIKNSILFLMRRKKLNGIVLRREWYCKGIPKKRWEECQEAIEDALNCTILEITYGGNKGQTRNRITIVSKPGTPSRNEERLYDDEG